jgi:methylmalonyl-CoA decarboxylase
VSSPAEEPLSIVSHDSHVAVISMAAPARRNTLSLAMIEELSGALDEVSAARAVILRSVAGTGVWCAGFDIGALSPGFDPLAQDGRLQGLFRRIQNHPAPVIAMMHGSAWGGGTDLALRCDIVIGDPTCTLAFTPARLGLPYDADGLLNVVMRAGPAAALEMFSTADPVSAERALRLGLLNHLVPEADLEAFTLAMARRIAGNAPLSVTSAKQQVRALAAAIAVSSATAQRFAEGRQKALHSHDFGEGLAAFRARRPPDFQGR